MDDTERLRTYLAELAARPTSGWVHVIEHDHRNKWRAEHIMRATGLPPDEAIGSRIKRLRTTPPGKGWSRDGDTLHIRHTDRDRWVTYLPADARAEPYRSVSDLH